MIRIAKITKEKSNLLFVSTLVAILMFSGFYAKYAYGEAVTLTTTIQSSLTFTTLTNQFGNLTPSTPVFATTTLSVTTNNAGGWNVTLSCDDRNDTPQACGSIGGLNVTELPDAAEWSIAAAAATTTNTGNAATISSGDNFLYFRMMTASGSVPFIADMWWGGSTTADSAFDSGTYWAGFASSTNVSRIGNAGSGSYQVGAHLNTVQYYLDVAVTQKTGAYEVALTYTTTAN